MNTDQTNKPLCYLTIFAALYLLYLLHSPTLAPPVKETFYGTYTNVDGFPQFAPLDSQSRPIWVYGAGNHYHTSSIGKESHLYRNAPLPADYRDYSK